MFSTGGGREEDRKKDTTVGGAEAHARFRQYEYRAVSCASHPRRQDFFLSLLSSPVQKAPPNRALSLHVARTQSDGKGEVKYIIAHFRVKFTLRNAL